MQKKKYNNRIVKHLISYPFIFVLIIPLIFMDILMEIYHRICFPLLGIQMIKRSKYIKIDRHKLSYLDYMDKIGCFYCGYANGILIYASVIAGETERYWCGIKHMKSDNFIEPKHHADFSEYGNEKEYKEKYFNN